MPPEIPALTLVRATKMTPTAPGAAGVCECDAHVRFSQNNHRVAGRDMEIYPHPSSCTKPRSICLDHPDSCLRIFFLKALMSPLPILLGQTTPGLHTFFFPNSHPNSPILFYFVRFPADKEHKPLLSSTEAFYERKTVTPSLLCFLFP